MKSTNRALGERHSETTGAKPGQLASAVLASPLLASLGIRDRQTLGWIQVKAPFLLSLAMQPIREAKLAASAEQLRRVTRIRSAPSGVSEGADYGPSIRQQPVYDHAGELLREADIEVGDDPDDGHPNRLVRRARRLDPLAAMKAAGAINQAQYDAGEWLRDDLERCMVALPEGSMEVARSSPWSRHGCSEAQSLAMARVRRAMACVAPRERQVVTWVAAGGSVGGFAKLHRCHHQRVSAAVRHALQSLAVHYGLCHPADDTAADNKVTANGKQ